VAGWEGVQDSAVTNPFEMEGAQSRKKGGTKMDKMFADWNSFTVAPLGQIWEVFVSSCG